MLNGKVIILKPMMELDRMSMQSYTQTEEHYVIDYPKVETVTVSSMKLQEIKHMEHLFSIYTWDMQCNGKYNLWNGRPLKM